MKKPNSKAVQMGMVKLASSGLGDCRPPDLALEFLSGEQTAKLSKAFAPLCSLRINYLGPNGKPLTDWPGQGPFYRLRYLEQPADFASLTDKKPVRYVQPPATAPVAYYAPNQDDWPAICRDVNRPLIITEGEFKAMKACAEGFPTVGLGGVYAWRSHKLGLEWLPSLDLVAWARRNVYLAFDSDYLTNPMVLAALAQFAEELNRRGAFVSIVTLPEMPGVEKTGLDDFLVGQGPEQLRRLLHEAEPLGLARVLFEFNARYVFVQDPSFVLNQKNGARIAPGVFKDHLEAKRTYQAMDLRKDGSIGREATSAAAAWIRWPLRAEVERQVYQPGKPRFIETGDATLYNNWMGWGVEPARGDTGPWRRLVDHIFQEAEPAAKEWFLRWCAFPLQYPGVKMFSSALVHGIRHGTGKSLIGYTLGKIYGRNFAEITQRDLHDGDNDWAENKQFVMGDDISGSTSRQDADLLKKLITQQEIRINIKYVPKFTILDCINYFFTANHPDAFFLDDGDRRHFIHEVTVEPLSEEFYAEYKLWLDTGGAAAVFHELKGLDLGGFNPAAPAFRTMAKERMTAMGQSDLATWVRELRADPDQYLRLGDVRVARDLFTSKELLELYAPHGSNLTANGMSRELARAGIRQVTNGRPVKLKEGAQGRYFAVRNAAAWLGASMSACARHIEEGGWLTPKAPKKKF